MVPMLRPAGGTAWALPKQGRVHPFSRVLVRGPDRLACLRLVGREPECSNGLHAWPFSCRVSWQRRCQRDMMFWSWPARSLTWQEPRSVQSFMKLLVSFALHSNGGHACMQRHQGHVRHLPGPHSICWYIACAYIGRALFRQQAHWAAVQQPPDVPSATGPQAADCDICCALAAPC